MYVCAVKIISVLALLPALGVCPLPVAAQDASGDFGTPDRTAQINASLGFADVEGTRLDMTPDGTLMALQADNPAFAGNSLMLAQIPLREGGSPKTAPISSLKTKAQNESVIVEPTGPPIERFVARSNPGLHFPLLKQATIANILVDLRKKYGPESMTRSGNFHWFYESQTQLATGNKAHNLVACNKMSQWWSLCASTNARTFSVYVRAF
ncbi:MAG TPA: hypothetical protein VEP67_00575 [Thiobacillaceae bacterium]|nr:hypothetical protein [Thiobacillaceae bacterium]